MVLGTVHKRMEQQHHRVRKELVRLCLYSLANTFLYVCGAELSLSFAVIVPCLLEARFWGSRSRAPIHLWPEMWAVPLKKNLPNI